MNALASVVRIDDLRARRKNDSGEPERVRAIRIAIREMEGYLSVCDDPEARWAVEKLQRMLP